MRAKCLTAMKWSAWLLLAITFVLLALVFYENRPRPNVPIVIDQPRPDYPDPISVAVWAVVGVFATGPILIWAVVVRWADSCRACATPLVMATVYVALTIPIYGHHCVYVNGARYYDPPAWVFKTFFAVIALGWLVGLSLFVRARLRSIKEV